MKELKEYKLRGIEYLQDLYIKNISKVLKKALNKEQLKTEIKGRPKSIYSIRRKKYRLR